jgi:hypothetical protein
MLESLTESSIGFDPTWRPLLGIAVANVIGTISAMLPKAFSPA